MKRRLLVRLRGGRSFTLPDGSDWTFDILDDGSLKVKFTPDETIVWAPGQWKSIEARTMGASI